MASVYLDSQSKNWKLKTKVDGKDKRIRLRKALPGETNADKPADVLAMAAALEPQPNVCENDAATEPQPNADSMRQFIEWHVWDYARIRRPTSIKKHRRIMRYFGDFLAGDCTVASIDNATIRRFFDYRRTKVKPHVAVIELTLVSGLFKAAVEQEIIHKNPCKQVIKTLRVAYPHPVNTKYLEADQINTFLESLDKAVFDGGIPLDQADCARLMLATGMRVGAACNLRWEWISPEGSVAVPAEYDKAKTGYPAMLTPKGKAVLERRRRGCPGTGRVFADSLNPGTVHYYLGKLGVFPHQLRHTFGTSLVDVEVPIQTIGSLLGHHNIKTTQRYAQVRDEAKRQAVARLPF